MARKKKKKKGYKVTGKLGTGSRFKKLKKTLGKKGAKNPGGLAAFIGKKKYGKKRFGKLSAKGRKKK